MPLTVTATVTAVRERELPALDEEFVTMASSSTRSTNSARTPVPVWADSSGWSRDSRPARRSTRR